jgi:hypothetical protein
MRKVFLMIVLAGFVFAGTVGCGGTVPTGPANPPANTGPAQGPPSKEVLKGLSKKKAVDRHR